MRMRRGGWWERRGGVRLGVWGRGRRGMGRGGAEAWDGVAEAMGLAGWWRAGAWVSGWSGSAAVLFGLVRPGGLGWGVVSVGTAPCSSVRFSRPSV